MANISFGQNILPKTNNTYTLGNSDYKWHAYLSQINGSAVSNLFLPSVSSTNNGQILTVSSGAWVAADAPSGLPTVSSSDNGKVLKVASGAWSVEDDTNTTYSAFVGSGSSAAAGLVPAPGSTAGTSKFLCEDGSWAVPPDTDTTYSAFTGATSSAAGAAGLVPAPTTSDVQKVLCGDGTWQNRMVILSYGSSTWDDALAAYLANAIIYCRASSNSNPATGSQTRMAFLAYVNDAASPTELEFQYYRSVSSHSATQMGDEVFVYKLNKTNGWSVTKRQASIQKITAGSNGNLSVSWSSNAVTIDGGLPAVTSNNNGKILKVASGAWSLADDSDTTYSAATTSAAGLMSATDKTKLDSIDTSLYAPKASPVLTGSVSLGRESSSTVGTGSIAIGEHNIASGAYSSAIGQWLNASGASAHAEGLGFNNDGATDTTFGAIGDYSHAEGYCTAAHGQSAHAEGTYNEAVGVNAHAEGYANYAFGMASHVAGVNNEAAGLCESVSGQNAYWVNYSDWAASTSYSVGDIVWKQNSAGNWTLLQCTTANSDSTFDSSHWDYAKTYLEKIGNGAYDWAENQAGAHSNARTLDWNGNERLKGTLYVNCNADSSGGTEVVTKTDYASYDNFGITKIASGYGLFVDTTYNTLKISVADTNLIKAGVHNYRPIAPNNQHYAVFYGLAKAAGDSTQSASTNAVGIYTADAKTAIQSMLGITNVPAVTSSDNGKVLRVVSGAWAAVELPSASGVSF